MKAVCNRIRTCLLALPVLLGLVMACMANAQYQGGDVESLTVEVGRSEIIHTPWPVARVNLINPEIADVQVLTPQRMLLLGNAVGSTDLVIWGEDDEQVERWRVDVVIDLAFLQDEVDRMFPTADVELVQSRETIVVRGYLRRVEDVERLRAFLASYGVNYVDMSSIAGVQQVLLEVRVAEVSRSAMRALGVNFFHAGNRFFGANVIGTSSGPLNPVNIGVPGGAAATQGLPFEFLSGAGVSPSVTLFGGFPGADLQVFIQALAENQYLRILAEPNLVALSGEEASFLAGGEFPIPVVQSGLGAAATISIEYREFGVRLAFKPIVLGDNTIRLYVAPEVSDLSDMGAVEIQGFHIPALLTRRAETTLELKSGQTFAMAGLLNHRSAARNSKVPLLGDLPVLGPLFRSVRYTRGETELAVLVTASLVEPQSLAEMPPAPGVLHVHPNDWELFIEGLLVGRGEPVLAPADAAYLQEQGLHRLRGPGAWVSYGSMPSKPTPSHQPIRVVPMTSVTVTEHADTEVEE